MSTLNLNKYDESSKIITCSNSLGDQPMSTLVPQKDIQALYRVGCKVLDYNDDNYSEEGQKTQSYADEKLKSSFSSSFDDPGVPGPSSTSLSHGKTSTKRRTSSSSWTENESLKSWTEKAPHPALHTLKLEQKFGGGLGRVIFFFILIS